MRVKSALIRTLLMLLGAAVGVSGRATTDWKNGIVKIETNAGAPGTGFVVALGADHVFIVTAAHVVEGAGNRKITFALDPYNSFGGAVTVIHIEGGEERGLALIRASGDLPEQLVALAPAESVLRTGDQVTVAGFPRVLGSSYTQIRPGVASIQGRDVILDRRVDDGYSGGPVLRDGNVGALVYGKRGDYGLAIPAVSINAYLSGLQVQWARAENPPAALDRTRELAPGTVRNNPTDGLKYVWIPPGTFQMGCVPGDKRCVYDEKPRHTVTISKGFWLGQSEVTAGAYERFAKDTRHEMPLASSFNTEWSKKDHPINRVTWDEATAYCTWIGGRLPAEAEWEYAARGGKDGLKYPWGNAISAQNANYGRNNSGTTPVAQYGRNEYGLYDVSGNVWEWTADSYDEDYYTNSPGTDPPGPGTGTRRVLRGGSWLIVPESLRASNRHRYRPGSRYSYVGFRCAREVSP